MVCKALNDLMIWSKFSSLISQTFPPSLNVISPEKSFITPFLPRQHGANLDRLLFYLITSFSFPSYHSNTVCNIFLLSTIICLLQESVSSERAEIMYVSSFLTCQGLVHNKHSINIFWSNEHIWVQITGEPRWQGAADMAEERRWVESKKRIQGKQKQVVGRGCGVWRNDYRQKFTGEGVSYKMPVAISTGSEPRVDF